MALKKERICVWITQEKRQGQVVFGWLACPLAHQKEVDNRLQSAYSKKVKGNRLKNLALEEVTSSNLAFCEEYVSTLFRIANLAGFSGLYWPKATQLEQALWTRGAQWLKEQFPNCEFVIYYNPQVVRLSTLKSWLSKNQLQAAELIIEQSSLWMATILFVGQVAALSSTQEITPALETLQAKVKREESMASRWSFLTPQELYVDLVKKEEQKAAQQLFKQVPELVKQGVFEKWLKKGWKAGALQEVLDYLEQGLPQDVLFQTPLAKIPLKAQELLAPPQEIEKIEEGEETEKAETVEDTPDQTILEPEEPVLEPFPESSVQDFFKEYMHWMASLPGLGSCLIVSEPFWPLWYERFLQQIEAFVQQTRSFARKPAIYMAVEGDQVWMLMSSIMPCLEQLGEEQLTTLPFVSHQRVTLKNVFASLEKMSHLSPLPNVCASKEILGRLHSWSVQNNLFLPLHELTPAQKRVVCCPTLPLTPQPSPLELDYFTQAKGTPWFSQSMFESFNQFQRDFLARYQFGIQETRLLAKAFNKGLSLEVAQEYVHRTEASILRLVRSYLYPTRIQNFLKQVDYLDELRLLTRSSLRLSQMEELLRLCSEGYPAVWLQANLKGNPTLVYLHELKARFPFGHVPASWQHCFLAPDDLLTWMFEATLQTHPKLDPVILVYRLFAWNCSLLDALLSRPFSQEEYEACLLQGEEE